jgi:hypothetical protein
MAEKGDDNTASLYCTGCGREVKCPPETAGLPETRPYCGRRGIVGKVLLEPAPRAGALVRGSIASIVCGLLGLLTGLLTAVVVPFPPAESGWARIPLPFVPLVGGLLALVPARLARKEYAKCPQRYRGWTLALAGELLGWGGLMKYLVLVVLLFARWQEG